MADSLALYVQRLLAKFADLPAENVEQIWTALPASLTTQEILDRWVREGILSRIAARAICLAHEGQYDEADLRQLIEPLRLRKALDRLADWADAEHDTQIGPPVTAGNTVPRLRLGQYLGRYVIKGYLGRGMCSQVYLSAHPMLCVPLAIKVFHTPMDGFSSFFAEQFRAEARTLARLDHPNIIRVYDMADDEIPFMALEYAGGPNLQQILAGEGALLPKRAFAFTMQIARALRAAHKAGIAHRDVKPANVLTTLEGVVKLGDFGIARLRDYLAPAVTPLGEQRPRFALGTPRYMAPEQRHGDGGKRSDVYALGILLFEMLTGGLPRLGREIPLVHTLVADVSPAVSHLIRRMTADDPEQRPLPTEGLLSELESAFGWKLEAD